MTGAAGPRKTAGPAAAPPGPSAAPSAAPPDPFVVAMGGDVALGGNVKGWLADRKYDPLAGLQPVTEGADLRVVSLASPLSARPSWPGKTVIPVAPPAGAEALARAGVNLVSVANDDLFSSGKEAFQDTLASLKSARVATSGAGPAPAGVEATSVTVHGWKVALVSVAAWPPGPRTLGRDQVAVADAAPLVAAVRAARAAHDLVLVSHHGGPLYAEAPPEAQTSLARAVLEAGADAFFASGARVPLGVAFWNGRPALHGLGNLVADEDPKSPWTGRGLLARVSFSRSGGRVLVVCPYVLADGEPKLLSGPSRATQEGIFKRTIARLSEPFGELILAEPDARSCMRVEPAHPSPPVTDSSAPR